MNNTVERTVIDGKELAVQYSNSTYAGEWVRESFAAAGEQADQGLLAGYATDSQRTVQPATFPLEGVQGHCSVFGTTGAGKTTLLQNLMIQWGFADQGFCYVAPFREEAIELLHRLPESRLEDVLWIETYPSQIESQPDIDSRNAVPVDVFNLSPSSASALTVTPDPQHITTRFVDLLQERSWSFEESADDIKRICHELLPLIISSDDVTSLQEFRELWSPGDATDLRSFLHRADAADVWDTIEEVQARNEHILWCIFPFFDRFLAASVPSAHLSTNPSLSMTEAIAENTIIIVAGSTSASQRLQMLVGGTVQQLWDATHEQSISEMCYPVVIDQANDAIAGDGQLYQEILRSSPSTPLSLYLSCQFPNQLADPLADCVVSQSDAVLSFYFPTRKCVVHADEMAAVADEDHQDEYMVRCGTSTVPALSRYEFRVGLPNREPDIATSFAKHPRLRSREEVTNAIAQSVETYGMSFA